jgi:hypothetical protein
MRMMKTLVRFPCKQYRSKHVFVVFITSVQNHTEMKNIGSNLHVLLLQNIKKKKLQTRPTMYQTHMLT